MATANEVSSNLLLTDVLTTDTLPGSVAKTPILNPLSNSQNIGGSALIADSKTQPVIEPEKLSTATDTLKSQSAIAETNSKQSDDSLIVSDTLKSGLSGSATSSSVGDTLSSSSDTDVKDTLTGISNDAPLSAIKDDTITATDSLTNPQSAEQVASDKTPDTLAEKETNPETPIAQNTSVSEPKATTSSEAIKPDNSPAEKPAATAADTSQDSNKTTEKPAATAADTSKDSNQEKSSTNSTDNNKQSTDNTEVVAVATPKELSLTVPTSDPVPDNSFTSGKFVVDSTGQVGIDFLFDGGLYKGQLAIISLKGMEKFSPGSEEFIKEAASRALSNSAKGHVVINDLSEGAKFTGNLPEGNSNDGSYLGVKTFAMTPGEEFGVMLVPNGTVQEVLNNQAIAGDKRPLFSMVTANPAEGFHVGQIADVTGSGKTFTMEDMRVDLGSDRDYNDFVFQVRGATGQAVNLDTVINADKDWRKTEMGKALIAYSKPDVEPNLEPAKEDAKPVNNSESNLVLDVPISDTVPTAKEDTKAVTNSVTTKDVAVSETKVTPTEEAKTDPIAPVYPATESVSKTEVATSDQAVTPAVTIEEEKKAIAPVSTPNESVSKTEVTTSARAVTPAVTIEEEKKAIAPVSTPSESISKTEVTTSDQAVTPAVTIEEEKKAIAPVSTPNESVSKTEVATSDITVAPAVTIEEEKKAIAPVSTPSESVSKTEVATSDITVAPAVTIEEEKKAIAPVSTPNKININKDARTSETQETASTLIELTHGESETGFFYENTSLQPTDSVKNPVFSIEVPNSFLTEPQTKTNTNQSTVETTNAQNPVVIQTQEVAKSELNIPTNNSLSNLTSGVWTVGETGQVSFDFLVDGGLYEGEIAIVNLSGMEQYLPNSDAFKQEAIKRALSSSELGHVVIRDRLEGARFSGEFGEPNVNSGAYQGIKTFAMPPGAKFAVMLVPNGTVQEISESPSLWHDKTPLFSIPAANADSQVMLADFTGKGNTFGWEDIPGNQADRDFNDLIFAIDGATANVPELAANVNANTQWLESKAGQEILTKSLVNDKPPAIKPVAGVALTPAQLSRTIDLPQVFVDPEASTLKYEVVEGNSASLAVSLDGDKLQLTGLPQSGVTDVVIRATDAAGNSVIHNFSVTTSNLSTDSIAAVNNALTDLTKVINQNYANFIEGLSSEAAAESLTNLTTLLEQYPDALPLFNKPDSLAKLGISDSNIPTLRQLLQSPEVGAEFGLSVSLGEALSHPDSTGFDEFLLNADEAISLLPSDAKQPKVGFIDFTEGEHVQRVTSAFFSINSLANYDNFTVNRGDWAEQLRRFVDGVKANGENRAIANLSFDLSQLDDTGITTRYELTPEEQAAIQYARENNVLLVVSAGNTGGVMSALGAASKIFDNIITVGAVNQFESKTDYSAYGDGLDLMAPGGSWANDPNAFVGTSRSASYVTAAASLVWAANPALSLTQVKQLLIDTAADLNAPGWDKETGSGLIDVKSAIDRALSVEPTPAPVKPGVQVSLFSGEGRVETLARAASEPTQKAISELEKAQQDLLEQWQILADLGNPSLNLSDLQADAIAKIADALNKYQQVSTDAGITDAHNQQRVEELALATSHYQIENERLQNLLAQQKELEDRLAKLGENKSALEAETQKLLEGIQAQIAKAELDLAKAQAKLLNPFANVGDNLQTDPAPWREAANKQQEFASNFQDIAAIQNAEAARFSAISNSINPARWQPVGSEKGASGRRREIWGWANDPNLLKQKNQSQWQSQIATQNSQSLQQLSQQAAQQEGALNQYAQFLEARPTNLGEEGLDKAGKVLQILQQQAAEQAKIAENYTNLAAIAGSRQQQNQIQANWHNSQINRWEQIGTKRTGSSGKNTEPVYGWVHYPEHIGPRDMAQNLANQAASESQAYAQLAQQAQQQASALKEQARKLETGIKDWPVLKQGIDYEIAADALRLQAEQDLLDLYDPVQRQKLEMLLQEIDLAEKELLRLENEKIPAQQQLTDLTENRLKASQAKLEAIQAEKAEAAKNLQNFLETAGFLLPYRERLLAVDKQIEKLESEQLDAFETMLELQNQLQKNPSDSLQQQLDNWASYLQNLDRELAWAKLQRNQLAMALADSPERLAIANLIKNLETAPTSINPKSKIQNLKSYEGSGANFLAGFDNLDSRLTQGKTEQVQTEKSLEALQKEYRELGLKKADLEDVQIPAKQKQIADKDNEIEGTESAIAQTQSSLSTVSAAQLTDIPSAIGSTDAAIQQQKSAVQSYQNQISQAFAAAQQFEQQRQANQNAANYWNGQIYVFNADAYLAYNPDVAKAFGWNQTLAYQHYLSYGRYEGRLPNPQAAVYRNNHQAAANSFAQQRDLATSNAQQLKATLQPQIATAQQQIGTLETDRNLLVKLLQLNTQLSQQQQRDNLVKDLDNLNQQKADTEQKLIDKYREIELTSQYLEQVEGEVERLQSRLDVLNRTGVLQTKYQQDWNAWQQANQTQVTATQSLLATRQAGEADRQLLADLQSQLKPAQENLQKGRSIETSLADTQQALAFTNLQIGNQNLVIQSAIDNDAGLAATERSYLNLADASRQKTWYWNGSAWAYNAGEAAAYRSHLQTASLMADERNKLWQRRQDAEKKINELTQKAAEQQSQIASLNSQLQALGGMPQLEADFNAVQSAIGTVNQRLQPLQNQENQLIQTIQNAASQAANLAGELAQTTQLKSTALRQLIGLGMLASEFDVDFFATQVEPQVNTHLEKLRDQGQDLTNQINSINELVANWEQQLVNTTDPVSQEYLKNLIQLSKSQISSLEALQESSQTAGDDLEKLLKQATEALLPLRQKQELEIRQKLESNENRLNALQSQLNSENAAEATIKDDTVLAHAQLTDRVRQDLTNSVTNTTQDLLEGNPMTKKLGDNQQKLSESVDTLIAEINDRFADPYGAYQRSEANLEDAIKTLGVVENRADALDGSVTSTEQAIEKIKLRIQQDEELWQEIAPIAIRYGVESQQLAEFTKLAQKLQAAKDKLDKKQPDAIAFATQEVLPIAQSLIEQANGNPALANYVEKVKELLAKFNDLATKQAASEAKATEVRQEWEDATNYDNTPINQINFGNKLVESRRGQDNLIYVRNSTDGGKTWTQWLHTGGSTNFDSIKTAVVDNKLFQSVRGSDNQIWGRSSTDGVNWGSWFPIGGAMTTDYSMDVVGKNLVFTVRNSDNKIYSRTAVNGTQWQNWEPVGSTMSDIVQDVVDSKFIQSYRGFDNQIYVRQSADGVKWENWEKIDAAIAKADWRQQYLQNLQQSDTHSLNPVTRTQYKDKLLEAVRGKDNLMYGRSSTDGGKSWSNWQYTNISINSDVQMVVANNALVQAVRGTDNILYFRQSNDGVNWISWTQLTGAISDDFSIDAIDNKVVFSVQGSEKKLYSRTLIPNVSWTNWEVSPLTTINPIEQKLVDGKIVQSYKGVDDRTYVRYSTDGLNWKNWETLESAIAKAEINQQYLGELQQNSNQNPNPVTRTQYKDKLVEAVRGKDNLMYSRSSTDGGKTWSNWQYTNASINSDVQMVVANNALVQAVRGTDNILYFRQSNDGVNWISWTQLTGAISDDFSIDAVDNKVVFSVRGSDNIFYSRTLIPNVRWTNWEPGQVKTIDGIFQEVVGGKVVQTYQGVDGQIYTRSTADGLTWSAWENQDAIAKQYQQEKEAQLPLITQETSLAARPLFLAENSENGTAIDLLQGTTLEGRSSNQHISKLLNSTVDELLAAEAVEGRNPNQALFDKAKAEQASHEAQGYAALAQADWYEQQAAYNWAVSRKNGPYWYEQRWVKGRSGKGHWETVTHVDHNWILWSQYSQIFPQVRQQGIAHLAEADKWRKEKERIEPLAKQWTEANNAANEAQPPVTEARNLFAQLEEARKSIPGDKIQLELLENLLPTLKQQLEQAEAVAAAQNAKVQQEWEDYDTNSEEYRAAVADILERRGELNKQAIETQQEIADVEKWVERQSVALAPELAGTKALIDSLKQQQQAIANQIAEFVKQGATVDGLQDLYSKEAQLKQTLQLLTNKAAILTAQQTALTQKRTLLTAQNEVILAEQKLLDAYIKDPDADTSNLQQQLQDARAALAEAQRLAEQAEAASKILTAPLQQLKEDLLVQNDEHLKQARENQQILKALVEATQANANYTLQAAQKQQEVNNLEFQILQRLQQATDAGFKEAKALLDVAKHNDMATAAEIYYRDYSDLASDRGSKSSPGLAQPQDRILADRYYQEMLVNRELQRRARSQADAFGAARRTAEAQMKTLQSQQETAAKLLSDLNDKIAETQDEKEKKEQKLAIAQARLDGITRIREQTEQTFFQLVTIEKLNLAQAQLEQEIAESRKKGIDEAVQARMERDRVETARQRTETVAKIEQLRQLQAEDNLRQSLNQARGNLGMTTLEATDDPMQLQTQLAGLLASLKDLETQQQSDLPADLKALLAEARGDIHEALQGKEAGNIQENLLKAMDGLIGQIQQYKTEISRIDLEEQWDSQLLQTAQTDLQGASQQLLQELQRAEELSGEKQVIEPLYMEALTKVAYAEQAVDISEDLAKQSKEMLDQIIKQRVAERKARKKAFWNKILGIISQVTGILSTVLMILSPAFPALIPFSIGLGAVSGAINTIQAVINGDWMGAIFSGVMTGLTAVSGGLGQMASQTAQTAANTIKTLQTIASGAFAGARSLMSGESVMGFLQILGSVASAASAGMSSFINQCSASLQKVMLSVVESLQQAPQMIYGGIKSIQSGDWLNAIGNFFNGALAIGQSFAGNFNTAVAGILENISKVGNTALYLGNAIKNGGIEGWLSGLNGILGLWKDDLMGMVDKISGKEECECVETPVESGDNSSSEQDRKDFLNAPEIQELFNELEQFFGLAPGYMREKVMSMSLEEFSAVIAESKIITVDYVLASVKYYDTPNKEADRWDETLSILGEYYQKNKGTANAAFAHQMYNLAIISFANRQKGETGETGWAGDFIRNVLYESAKNIERSYLVNSSDKSWRDQVAYVFDLIPPNTKIPVTIGNTIVLIPLTVGDFGALIGGGAKHFIRDLAPAFRKEIQNQINAAFEHNSSPEYVKQKINDIRSEHNALFSNAVKPGFNRVLNSQEISWPGNWIAQVSVPFLADYLREYAIKQSIEKLLEERQMKNKFNSYYTKP